MDKENGKLVLNRREFLNFAWLASLGFIFVDLGGVIYIFAMPRFREGEFGGRFILGKATEAFPQPGSDPISVPKGKFWLIRLANGSVVALYKVCTHLGCLYNWQSQEEKFICPCHGSQFELDGTYVQGPAPRSLDRFVVQLLDEEGNEIAMTDERGNPLDLSSEGLQVVIDTGNLVRGEPRGTNNSV